MSSFNFKNLFKGDKTLYIIYCFFIIISIVEVFSATSTLAYQSEGSFLNPIKMHFFYILLSAFLMLFCANMPKYLIKNKVLIIGSSLLVLGLLIAVRVVGSNINDAARWISIFGFRLQPSELFKFVIVPLAAVFISKPSPYLSHRKAFFIFWAFAFTCIIIIALDNLSTGLLLLFFVLLISWLGLPNKKDFRRVLIAIFALGVIGVIGLLLLPKEIAEKSRALTWKNRIERMLSLDVKNKHLYTAEQLDSIKFSINDKNFQEQHAKIAIANSRGIGVMPGNSKERDILPQAYSDYIFVIIIEELGFVGMLIVPAAYILFFFRAIAISTRTKDRYFRFILWGYALIYTLQALINFMVASGIMVTGQTLPLISRGGTAYLTTSMAFGIMIAISRFIEADENKLNEQPQTIEEIPNETELIDEADSYDDDTNNHSYSNNNPI